MWPRRYAVSHPNFAENENKSSRRKTHGSLSLAPIWFVTKAGAYWLAWTNFFPQTDFNRIRSIFRQRLLALPF